MRDSQRRKLYNAEKAVLKGPGGTIGDGSIEACKRWAEKVLRSAVVRRNYPDAPTSIKVKDGRGRTTAAAYGTHTITLPTWARTDRTILHELAHILNTAERNAGKADRDRRAKEERDALDRRAKASGSSYWAPQYSKERDAIAERSYGERAAHGWEFASILLDLVGWFMGPDPRNALREEFKAKRVRYQKPREISEETREAMRERFRRVVLEKGAAMIREGSVAIPRSIETVDDLLDELGEQWESFIERSS